MASIIGGLAYWALVELGCDMTISVIIAFLLIVVIRILAVKFLSGLAEMAGRAAVAVLLIPHFGFDAVCWNEGLTFLAGIAVILPIYIKLFCHLRKSMI